MLKQITREITQKIKKITLIETLVIFVIAFVAIFSLFWFSRKKSQVQIDLVAKPYPNSDIPPKYWITNSVHEGDQISNEFGKIVGTVSQVENVDYGGPNRFLRVTVGLDTIFNNRTKLYTYGNQRLRVGDELTLTIKNVKFTGLIQRIRNPDEISETNEKQFTVNLFMQNVPIWLVKTYDNTFTVSDRENHQIFQVSKVISNEPASQEVARLENGTIHFYDSELYRNIELEVKLIANCEEEVCYYNEDQPIRIGASLWVDSNRSYIAYATITEILAESDILKN